MAAVQPVGTLIFRPPVLVVLVLDKVKVLLVPIENTCPPVLPPLSVIVYVVAAAGEANASVRAYAVPEEPVIVKELMVVPAPTS